MAENMESSGSEKMTISVKTPKEKHDIEIDPKSTVKDLKEEVAKCFGSPIGQLCLIFAGKILKDGETLEQHGIKDGLTVHLVIKTNRQSQGQAAATPSAEQPGGAAQPSSPPPAGGLPGMGGGLPGMGGGLPGMGGGLPGMGGGLGDLMGLSGMGMGSGSFQDMQQRMQRELMNNPDMLRQMMENPFVQQMMSNPDIMRQLIMGNPHMREVMERNPEITHMLNNPEVMRQTMELARNPAMMQELMRSQDRAMSNLESLPGGFNALQRMYRDIQEPMMNAAQDSLGTNPFASLLGSGSGTGSQQQGRENTDPLPNPWSPGGGSSGGNGTTTTTTTTTSPSPTTPTSTSSTQGLLGAQGSMFSTPGMQSLMQQMMQNPQMIQSMMQAPYMQSMLQSMAANPQLAQQIMSSNPMFANNPQLMEQFRTQLPTMMQQLNNPQVQAAVSNPRVMEAMMQIQRGIQTLQSEAPSLVLGNVPGQSPANTTTTTTTTSSADSATTSPQPSSPAQPTTTTATATTTAADTASPSTTPATTAADGSTPLVPPMGSQDAFNNMMAQLTSMMVGGQLNQPPEQRYASQLEQLTAMGFMDREANIRALTATLGDVNAAIDRLLQQR